MTSRRSNPTLRQYTEDVYTNFKVQEFLDYMMFASEEEMEFALNFLTRKHAIRSGERKAWKWVMFGQMLTLTTALGRVIYSFDRLSTKNTVPRDIEITPWLRTLEEKSLYQNAGKTFWHLIFVHLSDVNSVVAFSQVSTVHWKVARTPGIYGPWIQRFMKAKPFRGNPFVKKADWAQFLCLSGRPVELWNQWVMCESQCFFMAVLAMVYVPTDAIFCNEKLSIRCKGLAYSGSNISGSFRKLRPDLRSVLLSFLEFTYQTEIMNKCME